jgi:hypothetical protein
MPHHVDVSVMLDTEPESYASPLDTRANATATLRPHATCLFTTYLGSCPTKLLCHETLAITYKYYGVVRIFESWTLSSLWMSPLWYHSLWSAELLHWTFWFPTYGNVVFTGRRSNPRVRNSGGWLCRASGGALTVCGGLCESDPRRRFRVDAPW